MGDFVMPSLGADMDFGTLTEWRVSPGDGVHRGDIVAVVDTEKATIEIEIFETGVIDRIEVNEGETVPVGATLAHVIPGPSVAAAPAPIASGVGAQSPAPAQRRPEVPAWKEPSGLTYSPLVRHLAGKLHVDLMSVGGTGPGGSITREDVERAAAAPRPSRVRSSPLARKLAGELGVQLSSLPGSGSGGAVVAADVRADASRRIAPPKAAPAGRSVPEPAVPPVRPQPGRLEAMRRQTGLLMARSKRDIPHYYMSTTIDMSAAVSWLTAANLERAVPDRLVIPVLLLKATAKAAIRVPEMNGFFLDGEFVPSPDVHAGVAISLRGGGLIAPAIRDTAVLSLDELMGRLRDLVSRARSGVLRSSEVSDATITVTNLGDLGVDSVFGVIYPPQVALVGFGKVSDRPVASGGMLGVRASVTATLSADHRASDGHRGGRFLVEIDRLLQEPEKL